MKREDTTQRLEEALDQVPEEERDALREMWRLTADADDAPTMESTQADKLWARLYASAKDNAKNKNTFAADRPAVKSTSAPRRRHVWRAAVAVCLLFLVGIILWLRPVNHYAPYGEQLVVSLPDGSTVELNSGSSLKHARSFSGDREVTLDGEAFFDVKKTGSRFTVHTFNAEVQVLGTTFNVKAWENAYHPKSSVTLATGSVQLVPKHNPDGAIVLSPGQTSVVTDQQPAPSEADLESMNHALAWRDGALMFKDQQIATMLEDIERKYGIEIRLGATDLASKEFTFVVRNPEAPEEVIERLCHALGLHYRPYVGGYEIYATE